MIEAERRLDAYRAQAVEMVHQIVETIEFERAVMHTVVADLVGVVGKAGYGEERDPMIRLVVGGPSPNIIAELNLNADDQRIPFDHLIEMARFRLMWCSIGGLNVVWAGAIAFSFLR